MLNLNTDNRNNRNLSPQDTMAKFQPVPTDEEFNGEPLSIEIDTPVKEPQAPRKFRPLDCFALVLSGCFIAGLSALVWTIFEAGAKWPVPRIRADAIPRQSTPDANSPHLIYGTAWKEEKTSMYVEAAVRNGFSFIDTANQPKHYNEAGVGVGWTKAAVVLGSSREQLYLQTKFSPHQDQDPNKTPYNASAPIGTQVLESAASSLENLQTDYLDALLLHSPYHTMEETMEAWQAMEGLVDQGTVRDIGISNCYHLDVLTQLYDQARIKPTILQNHFRVRDFEPSLLQFTRSHEGMRYQGFWTLTSNRKLLKQPEIVAMAEEFGLSPQAYMYAFLWAIGITPLDGTKTHQIEDANLMHNLGDNTATHRPFQSEEEIQRMASALGLNLP